MAVLPLQSATEALLRLVFTAVISVAHTDYLDGHGSGYTGQLGVHKTSIDHIAQNAMTIPHAGV